MKNDNKRINKVKDLQRNQQEAHKNEVHSKIDELYKNPATKIANYTDSKKLRWYDYITFVLISASLIGLAFIISLFGFKDISKTEWMTTLFAAILLLSWLIIGWVRNNKTARYFNDSRRRYQSTLSEEEGMIRRINKIILFSCLILLIVSIIFWIVL